MPEITDLPNDDEDNESTAAVQAEQVGSGAMLRRAHRAFFDATLKEIFLREGVNLRDPIGAESHDTMVYGGLYRGEEVAVKIFTLVVDDLALAVSAYGAFKVECEKTIILSRASPKVLHVIEYGELDLPDDMPQELMQFFPIRLIPFMITERAPYGSLDRVVRHMHQLPGFTRLKLMEALCEATEGLKVAHDHHIAHRDVKPQNVLIYGATKGKIADFGIAKWRTRIGERMAAMLTPRYSSPEQAFYALTGQREELVGMKGDIYSWAVMVYELVTGKHPFDWALKGVREHDRRRVAILKAVAANDRRGFQPTGDITFDAMIHACTSDYKQRLGDIGTARRILAQLVNRQK